MDVLNGLEKRFRRIPALRLEGRDGLAVGHYAAELLQPPQKGVEPEFRFLIGRFETDRLTGRPLHRGQKPLGFPDGEVSRHGHYTPDT
jgi:hypothetical protein